MFTFVHNMCIFFFSFVRSVTMDKWKDLELEKMKMGGNRNARVFFESQDDIRDGMPLSEKYNSKCAALYKDKVSVVLNQMSRFYTTYLITFSIPVIIPFTDCHWGARQVVVDRDVAGKELCELVVEPVVPLVIVQQLSSFRCHGELLLQGWGRGHGLKCQRVLSERQHGGCTGHEQVTTHSYHEFCCSSIILINSSCSEIC